MCEAKSCKGKMRHKDELGAIEAIRRMIRDGFNKKWELLFYKCTFCGFWHVGHPRKEEQSLFRDASKRRSSKIQRVN
jgi:hypothetical protein